MQSDPTQTHPTFHLDANSSVPFKSEGIIHLRLNVKIASPPKPPALEFRVDRVDVDEKYTDIVKYLSSLPFTSVGRAQTPFDINLKYPEDIKQQWILIELGDSTTWCFSPGYPGVTSKEDLDGDLFGLGWLKGADIRAGAVEVGFEDCTLVWFGLARMDAGHGEANPSKVALNFHVTLKQGDKRMPVIFDPDVRNPGGKIPP